MNAPALRLRPALPSDCLGVWLWRNAPEARAASEDRASIPYHTHLSWFFHACDPDSLVRVFILENHAGDPIGALNWAPSAPQVARVSIILDPGSRGQWLATSAIHLLAEQAKKADYRVLEAIVRSENTPSFKAFTAAGFWRLQTQQGAVVRLVRDV